MNYDQKYLDELNQRIPFNFWIELEQKLNKGKHQKNRLSMSTIKDSLRVYRDKKGGGKGRNVTVDKDLILTTAIDLLRSKGIEPPKFKA